MASVFMITAQGNAIAMITLALFFWMLESIALKTQAVTPFTACWMLVSVQHLTSTLLLIQMFLEDLILWPIVLTTMAKICSLLKAKPLDVPVDVAPALDRLMLPVWAFGRK